MSAGLDASTVTPGSTAPEAIPDDAGNRRLRVRQRWHQGHEPEHEQHHTCESQHLLPPQEHW